LGVGSTLEASAIADEIRLGIDASVLDGDLQRILKNDGYLSLRNVRYFSALLESQRREKWLRITVLVFGFLLALTIAATDRIRRQRNHIKTTEGALRVSERRFRELLENVKLVSVMTDLKGKIVFWNDYAAALTGWTQSEVVGRPAREFVDYGTARKGTDEASGAVPSVWTPPYREGRLRQKNGEYRWMQWSSTPLRDLAGGVAGLASLGEDVTELRRLRAEAARLESEEQFRNIADATPFMIWTAGPDMNCTFVNKAWLKFSGRELEEELGDGWAANIHLEDVEHACAMLKAAFEVRSTVELEYRKRRADGEYRWVLGTGVPRFGRDGQLLGYVGTCTDIAELKRRRDEDVARQKLETVGRLASGIAHDFNNILGGILAQADLGLAELSDGVSPSDVLNSICSASVRGAAIVQQLMIYAGQENAVCEPVDISWLVDDMRDLLNVVVSKHVTLQTELAPNLPAVQASPAELRQVLMNLVTNASEAIGEREGMIIIRTSRTKERGIPAGAGGDWLQLEVSDTGCGIRREEQPSVFDPFVTTKLAGHGLGLVVVQRIVQSLGGVIQLESEPGRGSTFRIVMPCLDKASPELDAVQAQHTSEGWRSSAAVLVVEDEENLRLAIARMLRGKGFCVVEAADGDEALAAMRAHRDAIRTVLLDMTLPGATSREVLAEARLSGENVKVIVTSAYGINKVMETFAGLEFDSFLRKPYRTEELVTMLLIMAPAAEEHRAAS
jgi:PAS domain S-box-containing protein